jgi:hypothetical protein
MMSSQKVDNALEDPWSETLPLSNVGSLYQSLCEGETKSAGLNRNRSFQSGYVVAEEDDHVGLGAVRGSVLRQIQYCFKTYVKA